MDDCRAAETSLTAFAIYRQRDRPWRARVFGLIRSEATIVQASFNASFAFQPIVDIDNGETFAYEALLRGCANEPAQVVFSSIQPELLHEFDRDARTHAIRLAASLGIRCALSLNFLPQSLTAISDAISSTLDVATRCGILPDQLILEITESEVIRDPAKFAERMNAWRSKGVRLAIDDFGAGYAGLNFLAEFQPDIVKLDMALVRDVDSKGPRQAIVRAVLQACTDLGLAVVRRASRVRRSFTGCAATGSFCFRATGSRGRPSQLWKCRRFTLQRGGRRGGEKRRMTVGPFPRHCL
jgi:blue light- and temperature-responsive anti-repressor